jgi:hypothetical protein
MDTLKQAWKQSKIFRIVLSAALVWFLLRLIFQIVFTAGLFPELTGEGGLPADLPVYMGAAQRFQLRQAIYPQDLSDSTYHYPYSPPFAMLSELLLWLPGRWTAMISLALIFAGYFLTYVLWMKIFERPGLQRAREKMAWVLPVWLVFAPFWGGMSYLNIGVIVALITTLLIKSILDERLEWAVPCLTFLLISKIMWAFPIALPLLLGQRRFFVKLAAWASVFYLALVGMSMLVAGPTYIVQQYGEYFHHLQRLTTEFPWHVLGTTPYFGYNHSIKQTVIFFLGNEPWVQWLATAIKIILLVPLAIISWQLFRHPRQVAAYEKTSPSLYIEFAFILYLGAFIWLDIIWELLLGIVIFTYLLAVLEKHWERGMVWGLFLVYALVDVIRLVSYAIGGDRVLQMDGEYILTDPSVYLPLALLVLLLFYAILVGRLWRTIKNLHQESIAHEVK